MLEYFAFEAQQTNETALRNFRRLASGKLRDIIYQALGYDPAQRVPLQWRHFHDRLLLDSSPNGYFNVFREMTSFVLLAMRCGMPSDDRTVPDISVGKGWADFWKANKLEAKYGSRLRHEHNYPSYFPQAKSNPQFPWVYPVEAIIEFRKWMDRDYIPVKFPAYIGRKVDQDSIATSVATLLLSEVQPQKAIAAPSEDDSE